MTRPSPQVAADADYFEAALKEARVPEALENGLWDVWVNDPHARWAWSHSFKDYPATAQVRYKAAGDSFDTYGQQIATAARELAQRPGSDAQAVEAQLQSIWPAYSKPPR